MNLIGSIVAKLLYLEATVIHQTSKLKAEIFSHQKLIGKAELRLTDKSMGVVCGDFLPNEFYYKEIQKIVWNFWSADTPDYMKWKAIKINVQLDNGCFLFAVGGITIEDSFELPDEPKRIDIAGIDRHVIEDFFLEQEPRPFVVEPWDPISVGQKIAFEDELKRELGPEKSQFINFFKAAGDNHILADTEFAALAQRTDDVLFRIEKQGLNEQFAVVHLTWRGFKENEGYPKVQLYESFDDFKYSRMYPDKVDWEY